MLSYGLAVLVGLWSIALYVSAFFLPEVHRRNDIVWSGVGMFYALALWIYGDRISGGLLVAQSAGVLLILWQGWQVLNLRRQVTPASQRTELPNGAEHLDELVGQQTDAIASKIRPKTAVSKTAAAGTPPAAAEANSKESPAMEPVCTLDENRAAFDEHNDHVESASSDPVMPPDVPRTTSQPASQATQSLSPEPSIEPSIAQSDVESSDTESTVSVATAEDPSKAQPTTSASDDRAEVSEHRPVASSGINAPRTEVAQPGPLTEPSPQPIPSGSEASMPTSPVPTASQPEAIAPEIIPETETPESPSRDRPIPTAKPQPTAAAEGKASSSTAPEKSKRDRPRPNIVVLPRRKRGLAGAMERMKGIFGGQPAEQKSVKPINPPSASQPTSAPQLSKTQSSKTQSSKAQSAPEKPDDDLAELNQGWDDWDDDASPQPERPPERSPKVLRAELISPYEETPPPSPYEEESSV